MYTSRNYNMFINIRKCRFRNEETFNQNILHAAVNETRSLDKKKKKRNYFRSFRNARGVGKKRNEDKQRSVSRREKNFAIRFKVYKRLYVDRSYAERR